MAVPATAEPAWLVPTQTSRVDASLTSTVPVQFDFQPFFGDPDVHSGRPGTTASGRYQANPVTQGFWGPAQSGVGPYGAVGAPQAQATASMSVTTRAFDRQVSSPTGDLWLASIGSSTTLSPVVIGPGKTIPVVIHSAGQAGTVLRGTVLIDSLAAHTPLGEPPNGNQVAAVPYSYTVGWPIPLTGRQSPSPYAATGF